MEQLKKVTGHFVFVLENGKSGKAKKQILDHLFHQRCQLKEVHSVHQCDVILVFCLISSRAGTDIDAALKELDSLSESKPAIFMVLHHTFDCGKAVPDSSRVTPRRNMLTVDCLFNEDDGLLKCPRNSEALAKVVHLFDSPGILKATAIWVWQWISLKGVLRSFIILPVGVFIWRYIPEAIRTCLSNKWNSLLTRISGADTKKLTSV